MTDLAVDSGHPRIQRLGWLLVARPLHSSSEDYNSLYAQRSAWLLLPPRRCILWWVSNSGKRFDHRAPMATRLALTDPGHVYVIPATPASDGSTYFRRGPFVLNSGHAKRFIAPAYQAEGEQREGFPTNPPIRLPSTLTPAQSKWTCSSLLWTPFHHHGYVRYPLRRAAGGPCRIRR